MQGHCGQAAPATTDAVADMHDAPRRKFQVAALTSQCTSMVTFFTDRAEYKFKVSWRDAHSPSACACNALIRDDSTVQHVPR